MASDTEDTDEPISRFTNTRGEQLREWRLLVDKSPRLVEEISTNRILLAVRENLVGNLSHCKLWLACFDEGTRVNGHVKARLRWNGVCKLLVSDLGRNYYALYHDADEYGTICRWVLLFVWFVSDNGDSCCVTSQTCNIVFRAVCILLHGIGDHIAAYKSLAETFWADYKILLCGFDQGK